MKLENYDRIIEIKDRVQEIDRRLKYFSEDGFQVRIERGCAQIESVDTRDEEAGKYSELAQVYVGAVKHELNEERKSLIEELSFL